MPTADAVQPALTAVLNDAYAAFASPPPEGLNVCTTCCMHPDDHRAMIDRPARQIREAHLVSWFDAAFVSETFSPRIGCFLAPRIMEFAAGDNKYVEHERMFLRVPIGDASRWTDAQNAVIRRYHAAFFDGFRKGTPTDPFLDDIFCMFSHAGFPARQTLDQVMAWSDGELVDRLWSDSQHIDGPTLWDSVWWDWDTAASGIDVAAARQEIVDWYRGRELRDRIDHFLETADPDSNTWARAADVEVALVRGFQS